jgi:hypothetical protein
MVFVVNWRNIAIALIGRLLAGLSRREYKMSGRHLSVDLKSSHF